MVAERIFADWFDRYIKPAPSKLWVSAVAPDAVQGKPHLLKELLQRGVDEPDALARRRASARYGACLIARVLDELQLEPDALQANLSMLDFLRYPDTILEKQMPDSILKLVEELMQRGYDPTLDLEEKVSSARRTFDIELNDLRQLFGIEASSITPITITSFFADEGSWWGTKRYAEERLINLLPQFLFLTPVREGLLLREGIRHILPTAFQESLDNQEFVNTITTQLLPDKFQETWQTCQWGGKPPSTKQAPSHSTITPIIEKLLKTQRLPQLFRRLEIIDNMASSIPFGSLPKLAAIEIEADITESSLKDSHKLVLLHLSENPNLSERQLTDRIQSSRGTVRRNLVWLRNQFNLEFVGEINYQRLGLTPILLLLDSQLSLKTKKIDPNVMKKPFESFPFCTQLLSPLSIMNTGLFAIFTIPKNVVSTFHHQAAKWLKQKNAYFVLSNIHRVEWGYNFLWWHKFKASEWDVISQSQLRERPPLNDINKGITYEGKVAKLTHEILRALLTLEKNFRISTRHLAKNVGVSVTTAGTYLKQLIPNLIIPRLQMTPKQLSENIILIISAKTSNSLIEVTEYLRLLPAYQFWYLQPPIIQDKQEHSEPSLLCAASLPKGGLVPFLTSLSNILKIKGATLAAPHFISALIPNSIRELPIALFDSSKEEWICPPNLVEELFKIS